jgi:hypothetical protein
MIPPEYVINDKRDSNFFKKTSFTGYCMKDVLAIFTKSIINNKIEDACNWGVELLISGHVEELFDKLIIICMKHININNPNIAYFIYDRYSVFIPIKEKYKNNLSIRNNQQIRNMVAECCFIVCNSLKTKPISCVKIKDSEFDMICIESKFIANSADIVSDKIKYGDPEETKIILNEFNYCLINKKYEMCVYWLSWICELEKKSTKKNKMYICGYRKIQNIDTKYCNDIIWFIWEIILNEVNKLGDDNIIKNVYSLYKLYKYEFRPSKKTKRMPYIIYAIKYFTDSYHFTHYCTNFHLMVQVCANINVLFFDKNKFSVNNSAKNEMKNHNSNIRVITGNIKNNIKKKKVKELKHIANEKMRLKITKVEEIDSIILNNSK